MKVNESLHSLKAPSEAKNNMAAWTVWMLLMCAALSGQGSNGQECGRASLNTRVVGGGNATAGSWPWQVSMHLNIAGFHICGGTLINNQWVLTAAHCILLNSPSSYTLYFGRETQNGPNPNEVSRRVSQIIIHPNYNNSLFNNDIALMRLSSPVTFTDYISPVCLASNISQFHSFTSCWATGWGRINRDEALPDAFPLQEVQIPVIGNNQCTCNYDRVQEANITDRMICAGQANKGICQGDSGGPLQCQQGSVWIQAGIASFGVPCALDGFPEVFARVSEFESWITDQVGEDTVGFVNFSPNSTDPDTSFECRSTNSTEASSPDAAATIGSEVALIAVLVTMLLLSV